MIAALICVVSVVAFLQFFISYCRSLLAANRNVELSLKVLEVTGVMGRAFTADDFHRLLQFIRLCPEGDKDDGGIRAVRAYYRLLGALRRGFAVLVPNAAAWAERERQSCAYFAAVALDRRITRSRELFHQQSAGGL